MNSFYHFIIYIVVSFFAFFLVERLVRRKWGIRSTRKMGYQGINSIHTWGQRIIWAVFFVNVVFDSSGLINAMIIMVLCVFDTFMQWKFNHAEREYIISFMGLVFFILFISVGYTFELLL
ncbi:DUF4181 domain-containing protein [Bacillus sp. BHET2]|uniref:DUF4181 domain-containing protein n=1 Tax=Bacillus sp. BHET2 TaxID=2583818 RepID=UPI00110D47A2|nr:DUF4181 domain-containing protein [Bacillus sp. BHET2]TMU87239.1 DUF4181 domain-containing protein [Bacillus sp. BHET2]